MIVSLKDKQHCQVHEYLTVSGNANSTDHTHVTDKQNLFKIKQFCLSTTKNYIPMQMTQQNSHTNHYKIPVCHIQLQANDTQMKE